MLINGKEVSKEDTSEIIKLLQQNDFNKACEEYRSTSDVAVATASQLAQSNDATALTANKLDQNYKLLKGMAGNGQAQEALTKFESVYASKETKSKLTKAQLYDMHDLKALIYKGLSNQHINQPEKHGEFVKLELASLEAAIIVGTESTNQSVPIETTQQRIIEIKVLENKLEEYKEYNQQLLLASTEKKDQNQELVALLALGSIAKHEGETDKLLDYHSRAFALRQGPLDHEAYLVGQHEMGVSNCHKMGTDNIQQCVAVVIHNPENNNTVLIHVDRCMSDTKLANALQDFEPGAKLLNVQLVGGRDRSKENVNISDNNISNVINVLKTFDNMNIVRATIGDENCPSSIVVNPATGEVKHSVAAKEDPGISYRAAKIEVAKGARVSTAFNFQTTTDVIVPQIEISASAKTKILEVALASITASDYDSIDSIATFAKPIILTSNNIREKNQDLFKSFMESVVLKSMNKEDSNYIIADFVHKYTEEPYKGKPLSEIKAEIAYLASLYDNKKLFKPGQAFHNIQILEPVELLKESPAIVDLVIDTEMIANNSALGVENENQLRAEIKERYFSDNSLSCADIGKKISAVLSLTNCDEVPKNLNVLKGDDIGLIRSAMLGKVHSKLSPEGEEIAKDLTNHLLKDLDKPNLPLQEFNEQLNQNLKCLTSINERDPDSIPENHSLTSEILELAIKNINKANLMLLGDFDPKDLKTLLSIMPSAAIDYRTNLKTVIEEQADIFEKLRDVFYGGHEEEIDRLVQKSIDWLKGQHPSAYELFLKEKEKKLENPVQESIEQPEEKTPKEETKTTLKEKKPSLSEEINKITNAAKSHIAIEKPEDLRKETHVEKLSSQRESPKVGMPRNIISS